MGGREAHASLRALPVKDPERASSFTGSSRLVLWTMQALDELVGRWRKNPDPESTVALCSHLGTSREAELLREVGNTAGAWHRENHSVMSSVGRMYLDAGLLAEAHTAFLQAGKLAPKDPEAYRYLGEVLLRRGDAVRSEKTLARAIQLGASDAETRIWHERAVVYAALQQRKGMQAVADEVLRTAPHQPSIPAPTLSPFDREPAPGMRSKRRSRPPPGASRSSGPRRAPSAGPSRRRASTPPPATAGTKTEPLATLLMGRSPVPARRLDPPIHPPSPFAHNQSLSPPAQRLAPALPRAPRATLTAAREAAAAAQPYAPSPPLAKAEAPGEAQPESDPFRGTFPDDADLRRSVPLPEPERVREPPSASRMAAAPSSGPRKSTPTLADDAPAPETVLLSLSRVGLYETDSTVVPAWEATTRAAPRRAWVMAGGLLLVASAGWGAYLQAQRTQNDRVVEAQTLSTRLAGLLDSGNRADLLASEPHFQRLFEVDSRGREPALLWLQNRVLYSLLGEDSISGIESATERARLVGVPETRLVFGRLASALAVGDLPGAGQLISEWDERARDEPLYQLLAGAVLERAGNPDALARFIRAISLQPDLKLAHLMAARLAAVQLDLGAAKPHLELAYGRLGPGPATQILKGLEWAVSPVGDSPAPALPGAEAARDMPDFLRATASAVVAVQAARLGQLPEANAAFALALGPTTTPVMAAWLGYQALQAGDLEMARSAALKALQLSAQHKHSLALSARIALAEGRLADAAAAVRGLDTRAEDAVLIEAVSAYENLQAGDLKRLVSGLPGAQTENLAWRALGQGENVILGQDRSTPESRERWSEQSQIWGGLIAADLALDRGQLDQVEALANARGWDGGIAAYAQRLMRLRRYRGQFEAALDLAPPLLDQRQATPRGVAEVVLAFVDAGRATGAQSALEQAENAAGAFTPWLQALVESARGRQTSALRALKPLLLPGRTEPLLLRAVALRALALAKDRRAKTYYAELARRYPTQPDVLAAGRQLGLSR
jgi:tetratricopeptide (TPR) repeat protein